MVTIYTVIIWLVLFDRILPFFFPPYVFAGVMIQESSKNERSCKLFIASFSEWELGNTLLNPAKRWEMERIINALQGILGPLIINPEFSCPLLQSFLLWKWKWNLPVSNLFSLFYATCGKNNLKLDPPTLLNSAQLCTQWSWGCLFPEILLKAMGSQLKFGWSTAQSKHIAK